jgi:hypothetical protein
MQITPLIVESIAPLLCVVAVLKCAVFGFVVSDGTQRNLQLAAQALDRRGARHLFSVDDLVGVAVRQAGAVVDVEVRQPKLGNAHPEEGCPVRGRSDQMLRHG